MLLNHAKSNIVNSGSLGVQQATIDMNPTIMHVLSRDLYQRPIEAVVRETLTNALDAHVEAGTTHIPVDIKLPNWDDELFYIRDYGPGLSVERVNDLYLVYGKSTRRESNDYSGAFGLGCKASLAYTTSFMVTSYHEGQKHEFLVYYDQDNIPCLDHRSSELTDEPSGLKISLSMLNSTDYVHFHSALAKVLQHIPESYYNCITNGYKFAVTYPEYTEYGPLKLKNTKADTFQIIMGYVAYDVDIGAVTEYLTQHNKQLRVNDLVFNAVDVIRTLNNTYDVTIKAELGRYPIHPSREFINITPRAIKHLLEDINEGVQALVNTLDGSLHSDLLFYQLTRQLPCEDFKLRARLITPSGGNWSSTGYISQLCQDYSQLLSIINQAYSYDHTKNGTLTVCKLNSPDFVDFVGNSRRSFSYKSTTDKPIIVFIDEPNSVRLINKVEEIDNLNFDNEIATVRRAAVDALVSTPNLFRRIQPTRSMQDPSHNVLQFVGQDGSRKKDWRSGKHNVESLQALGREVFWVPTRMGCVKDAESMRILTKYANINHIIPLYKRPVIIGLPATKGTMQIQQAFKPLSELDQWLDDFASSPYFVRRHIFYAAYLTIDQLIKIEHLEVCRDYGWADWLYRVYMIGKKYAVSNMHSMVALNGIQIHGEFIISVCKDVISKFNYMDRILWHCSYHYHKRDWPAELAGLLNCHPTSAKHKNQEI